jgi:hypothetical protein
MFGFGYSTRLIKRIVFGFGINGLNPTHQHVLPALRGTLIEYVKVFLQNLTTMIKLLFWPTSRTSKLFSISYGTICNLG